MTGEEKQIEQIDSLILKGRNRNFTAFQKTVFLKKKDSSQADHPN
tara:strand:+ start:570 stop:704 length:135 start_codon:yes stop_codon:yes gene_type:complete